MTESEQMLAAAFIMAASAKCNAEVAGMVAENDRRRIHGMTEAYTEAQIMECAEELHDLPKIIDNAMVWC